MRIVGIKISMRKIALLRVGAIVIATAVLTSGCTTCFHI